MENLTIDKEAVLKAAENCPTAKKTLEILFPSVFEEQEKYYTGGAIFGNRVESFILCQISEQTYNLFCTHSGNRRLNKTIELSDHRTTEKQLNEYYATSVFKFIGYAKDLLNL